MEEQKCSIEIAEHYVNDLFETLELKGNNQKIFNHFVGILLKQTERSIKENWKHVVFACELPNGQMAGKLPKLEMVDRIFKNNNYNNHIKEHSETKKDILSPGAISKLYDLGRKLHNKEITKGEFNEAFEEATK